MLAVDAAPPLAFDARLGLAARNHAAYLVRHDVRGHDEDPAKEGFSGRTFSERIESAGLRETGSQAENVYASVGGIWEAHGGFSVEPGRGDRAGCRTAAATGRTCTTPGL